MAKTTVNCGYTSVNLIRKPFKGLTTSSDSASGLRLQPLGDFNLIPVDGYYNVENKIFPLDSNISGLNESQWKIYVISDPEVGILIPHIKKETKNNFIIRYKNIDLDGLFNKSDIDTFLSSYKVSVNDSTDKVSVTDFIFAQPVFLRKTSGSSYSWSMYLPAYKVNDDDIVFEYQQWDTQGLGPFGDFFTTNSSLEINDVVISNQDVDDMHFSQFGIGKNGISLKNGLSYTISNTGDVNFNVGNIKSDTTPFMKVRMKLDGASTPTTFDKKLDSDSYKKGDVLSGTLLTSLMGTILQNLYSKLVYSCTTAGATQTKSVTISESTFPNEGILVHLKNANTAESPKFKYNRVVPAQTIDNAITSTALPITYNNKTGSELTTIPAGYYKVTPIYNNYVLSGWQFTRDSLYTQINLLMNKISKFDFLIVKK